MHRFRPALVVLLAAGPAAAQVGAAPDAARGAPLSAIDWLSQSVEGSSARSPDRSLAEPPVAASASAPAITVTSLDVGPPRAGGVLGPEATGLPSALWAESDEATLLPLIAAADPGTLPALRDLLVTLMLAEADPPTGASPDGRLFLARVDKLLDMGAVEPAQALLEADDLLWPEAFRRWFDVTLLTGTEDAACDTLRSHPRLAPTLTARVFCTARNGDWPAAALTLNTARVLGDVTPEEEALLARFLDPEIAEEEGELLPPGRLTPLDFRLREAIGEAVTTTGLPLAFAHADLRPVAAWRAQIEAAERLARNGVLSENVLLGLYTASDPAASGGVWDRAAAVQALDEALREEDAAAVAEALHRAWAAMGAASLEIPFARLFGPRLVGAPLDGEAAALAFRVALLSPAYEEAALAREPASLREALWRAVARGEVAGVTAADGASAAVLAGFGEARPSPALSQPLAAGRVGEAILRAIEAFNRGLDGDHAALTDAIVALRALGLEDTARQAALQFLLLEEEP